ncbi:hypothetical protein ABFZ85_03865 [Hyphococcus formosus]|uniref:hypothetical protein n=1 Tax=Hyphococcus formosus TaxID=3143534 RepID=UPI00398B483A
MFTRFSGGESGGWPLSKVVGVLEDQFGALDLLGEDGPLKVYGIQENGVNFVVALMQSEAGSGLVEEYGFLARFVGFSVTEQLLDSLNRNLHVSMVAIEAGDLFLMASMRASGKFDPGQFKVHLESWRRDLMMTLYELSDAYPSMAVAFPAAKLESARDFAVNVAPAPTEDRPVDLLASYLGARSKKAICLECNGRGKRGFIASTCRNCDGTGLTNARH